MNEQTVQREIRKRAKVDRLGIMTDQNYNDMIEQLNTTDSEDSNATTTSTSIPNGASCDERESTCDDELGKSDSAKSNAITKATSTSTSIRGKGAFDEDDCSRVGEPDDSRSAKSNAITKTTSTQSEEKCDKGNCCCVELLKHLVAKTDAIENHIIKLNVKINNLDTTSPTTRNTAVKLGHIDINELSQFGMPLDSETKLQGVNEKLKNDNGFKIKLVNCFSFFIYLRKSSEAIYLYLFIFDIHFSV